jgi:integrase
MVDHVLACIRRVFNWHASRSDTFRSPIVRGMSRTKPKERERERVLDDDELRAVWRATAKGGPFHRFVRFILLTCARRKEAALIVRSEISERVASLAAPVGFCREADHGMAIAARAQQGR